MNEAIDNLVEALREELKQYGEMLALLDQQQECVLQRQTQDLLQTVDSINTQGVAIQGARRVREQYQRSLARRLGRVEESTFTILAPLLPPHYRGLLQALVDENNDLLQRIQHRARQNHLLLSRVAELMQRFMNGLFPSLGTTTYNGEARLTTPGQAPRAVYEAVG